MEELISIIQLLGHRFATPLTGSYLCEFYEGPVHCIICGDTVIE